MRLMDCDTFRRKIAAEPGHRSEDLQAHAAGCAACHAWSDRLDRTERLLGPALRFDVAAARATSTRPLAAAGRSRWTTLAAGMAAGVVAALILGTVLTGKVELSADDLALAIVDHYDHEPESLARTDTSVASERLAAVLSGRAVLGPSMAGAVSFVKICNIGGQRVPHLVIQGRSGPFMVVLMPGRALENEIELAAPVGGLAGRILPVGNGSIAVLGPESDEVGEIEALVSDAVSWAI